MLASGAITPDSDVRAYRSLEDAAGINGVCYNRSISLAAGATSDALIVVVADESNEIIT